MFLHRKIILFLILILAIYLVVSYLILNTFVVNSFRKIEDKAAVDNTERVVKTIEERLEKIKATAIDYALRHELSDVVQSDLSSADDDIHNSTDYLRQLELNMRLIYSKDGKLISHAIIDSNNREVNDVNSLFIKPLKTADKLINHEDVDNEVKGIFNTRLGPMLLVSVPILSNQANDAVAGALIQGVLLSDKHIQDISRQINVDFKVFNDINSPELEVITAGDTMDLKTLSGQLLETQDDALCAYIEIKDINGRLGIWIKTTTPRTISLAGKETAKIAFSFELIGSVILVLGIWFFLIFFVIGRIEHLTQHVTLIQHEGDLTKRLNPTMQDEIGTLARKFDQLIERLQQTSNELSQSRDKALELSNVKSAFLATMSHEIRTPLNGMLAFAELLQDSDLTPEQKRYAELIYTSGENLLEIINDVLDFSKIEAGKIELEMVEFDLRHLVEEVSEILAVRAYDKGLDLVQVIPPELNEHLKGDPTRLRQVLINLLGNAIKFTEHGQVVIRVSTKMTDDEDELDVRFEVEDTGIGIAEKQKQNIFKSFTQEDGSTARKFGGSGLGLAISQQLIRKMGSNIFVQSKPGEGSLFWFTVRFEVLSDAENKTRVPTAYLKDKSVMVVDDNQTNLDILDLQLKNWGLNTELFNDGEQALSSLQSSTESQYDVLLLDRRLNNMDGMDLTQKIREIDHFDQTPVIILSSSLTPNRPEQIQQLNIAHVLQKPVRQADLYKSLSEVLGKMPSEYRQMIDNKLSGDEKVKFNARVLVAEDNPMNQLVARTVLEKCGCTVVIANDGQEAIHSWVHSEIDIILMDLRMPVLDGFAATTTIREKEREELSDRPVPIIALTADVVKEVKDKAITVGMNDYLAKPFTQVMLTDIFAKYIPQLKYVESASEAEENKPKMQASTVSEHIDLEAIELLRDLQEPDDDDNVVIDMIESYFQSSKRLMQPVKDFSTNKDLQQVVEAVHSLKSSSGYLGAIHMVEFCKQINTACKANDAETALELCQSLDQEYEDVLEALTQLIEKEKLSV